MQSGNGSNTVLFQVRQHILVIVFVFIVCDHQQQKLELNTEREYTEKECAVLNASLIVPPCNCEELSKEYWNITFDHKITDESITQEWRKRKR